MKEMLLNALRSCRKTGVFLAYSGGVDSALLLALCIQENVPVTAVTFQTTLHPQSDLKEAQETAARLGARHIILPVNELSIPEILENPPERCYFCKRFLFQTLRQLAESEGCSVVMDGTNADDLLEYRPGLRALRELSVRSPLAECGISKAEVRAMASESGLSAASRPSSPCLATRLPYHTAVTRELLQKIDAGESLLKHLGFPVVRLRVHPSAGENLARIEIPLDRLNDFLLCRETAVKALCTIGFSYVTLDLEGFRSGSYDRKICLSSE